jgi:hypothetical protein
MTRRELMAAKSDEIILAEADIILIQAITAQVGRKRSQITQRIKQNS